MANVKMEELARVQTVGPGGIGVYPPVPTEKVDKVSSAGLGKEELQRSANVLPHPGAVDDGAVMQEIDGAWSGGQGGGGSADIDLGVTDASVGDYLKVKSVDEDGKPTAWESEPVDTETIVEATDAWLEENVAQETGYVLDSTLTMPNAASPADKVGELKTAIINKTGGYIKTASGTTIRLTDVDSTQDKPIKNVLVNGITSQDGTPAPLNPVSIIGYGTLDNGTYYVDVQCTNNGVISTVRASGLSEPLYDGDILDFVNGTVTKYNRTIVYNGTENGWSYNSGSSSGTNLCMYITSTLPADYGKRPMVCNRFVNNLDVNMQSATADTYIGQFAGHIQAAYSNYLYFRVPASILSAASVAAWKTWLSSNNLVIVAKLKTPTTETVTISGDVSSFSGSITFESLHGLTVKYAKDIASEINTFEEKQNEALDGVRNTVSMLTARVSKLENDTVPTYYESHLEAKIAEINSHYASTSDQFVFITDQHYNHYTPTNQCHSSALIRNILENTMVNKVVNGGDVINGGYGENQMSAPVFASTFRKWCYSLKVGSPNRYFYVLGNHDSGADWNTQSQISDVLLTNDEIFECCGMQDIANEITQKDDNPFCYYWDNIQRKIRYIVLAYNLSYITGDTEFDRWLWCAETLQSTPVGYTVVILNHIVYSGSSLDGNLNTNLLPMLDAFNARSTATLNAKTVDFSHSSGKIACLIGGHVHIDRSTTSNGGIPIITTTTDNVGAELSSSSLEREVGTITEQAFDVYTIDTANSKIYATRIGAGEDREFSY